MGLANILFLLLLIGMIVLFSINVRKIARNIKLGKDTDRSDNASERIKLMLKVAFGQTKMAARPIPFILHFLVYAGFIIVNIEVLEIMIDGISGTHRVLSFLGPFYNALIFLFEWLAVLVIVSCILFLTRRYVLKIKRFWAREMTRWPRTDAGIILLTEIALMFAFLTMNAADYQLQQMDHAGYTKAGAFPIGQIWADLFLSGSSAESLVFIERICWWFHIVGILVFLNYLPYSKHFHIILAFPNVYFSKLSPMGKFTNMPSVTKEVKLMMDPNADPYAAPAEGEAQPEKFGASDVTDLTWKQLMDAYSCTECGRCTSVCPANLTGKLLSPRKIMMDTRDRVEEVGGNIAKNGTDHSDGKSLIGEEYITPEELWACTTCNACVDACPVNIDPLSIIVDLRRYLVMEQSSPPNELAGMFTNVENNGAPWQFAQADRLNWAQEDV